MILTKIPSCLPNLWAFEMEKDMFLVSVELKFYTYNRNELRFRMANLNYVKFSFADCNLFPQTYH